MEDVRVIRLVASGLVGPANVERNGPDLKNSPKGPEVQPATHCPRYLVCIDQIAEMVGS